MIYLSYFNNPEVRKSTRKKYSVARHQFVDMPKAKELMLPRDDFNLKKSGVITFKELCIRYHFKVLVYLNPEEIRRKYDGAILCCHEVSGCHRDILRAWLNDNGIDAEEYRR